MSKYYYRFWLWWWDRQEHKLTNRIFKELDRWEIVYLHRNEESKPVAAIVWLDCVDKAYIPERHSHFEGDAKI